MIVRVGFSIWNGIELVERLPPSRRKNPQRKLILRGIVALRLRKRHAVLGHIRQTQPKAICLQRGGPPPRIRRAVTC